MAFRPLSEGGPVAAGLWHRWAPTARGGGAGNARPVQRTAGYRSRLWSGRIGPWLHPERGLACPAGGPFRLSTGSVLLFSRRSRLCFAPRTVVSRRRRKSRRTHFFGDARPHPPSSCSLHSIVRPLALVAASPSSEGSPSPRLPHPTPIISIHSNRPGPRGASSSAISAPCGSSSSQARAGRRRCGGRAQRRRWQ